MEEEQVQMTEAEKQNLADLERQLAGLEDPKSAYQLSKQFNTSYSDPKVESKISDLKKQIAIMKDPLSAEAGLTPEQREYFKSLRGQMGELQKGISLQQQAAARAKESARVGAAQSLLAASRRGGAAAARQAGLAGSREAALQSIAAREKETALGKQLAGARTEFVGELQKVKTAQKQKETTLATDIATMVNDMESYLDNTFYTSADDVRRAKLEVNKLLAKYADDPAAIAKIKMAANRAIESNTEGAIDTSAGGV